MYSNNTPKSYFGQAKKSRTRGFTLVEIMIVIVIIVILTQLGNIGGLFRSKERSKIEEIAVKIVSTIDEEKVNALLWKTEEEKIVRKRLINISLLNTLNTFEIVSKVNLAEDEETIYDTIPEKKKSWSLTGLETFVYECPSTSTPLVLTDLGIEFINDIVTFTSTTAPSIPNHIVLLLTHVNTSHEIHIDRRTWLTYELDGKWKDSSGSWQVTCN